MNSTEFFALGFLAGFFVGGFVIFLFCMSLPDAVPQQAPPPKKQLTYKEYLRTQQWKDLREETKRRDNWQCVECGSYSDLQVHHLTYERIFNERLSDLVTLCPSCHQKR